MGADFTAIPRSPDFAKGMSANKAEPHQLPHSPEAELWHAFWIQLSLDINGYDNAAVKQCDVCLEQFGCSCKQANKATAGRHKTWCDYKPHTRQQCAVAWLDTPEMEVACSLVGLEPSYVRANIRNPDFNIRQEVRK